MKWGIRKRFQNGTYMNARVPYGYTKTENVYEIDSAQADVVRRIFYGLASGKAANAIAVELNEDGVPCWSEVNDMPNREWNPKTVREMAKNPFYIGDTLFQKSYKDENYKYCMNNGELDQYLNEGDYPTIIDRKVFEKVQEVLKQRGVLYANDGIRNRYCFSGKVFCGECGTKMNRGGTNRPYLICYNHYQKKGCTMKPKNVNDLENAFTTVLNKLAFGEEHLKLLSGYVQDNEERKRLEAKLASIEARQSLLHDRALAERYTAELREKKAALDAEEKAVREELARLEEVDDVKELINDVKKRGISGDFDEQIFTSHVDNGVVWSRSKAEFHFKCGLVFTESLFNETQMERIHVCMEFEIEGDGDVNENEKHKRIIKKGA